MYPGANTSKQSRPILTNRSTSATSNRYSLQMLITHHHELRLLCPVDSSNNSPQQKSIKTHHSHPNNPRSRDLSSNIPPESLLAQSPPSHLIFTPNLPIINQIRISQSSQQPLISLQVFPKYLINILSQNPMARTKQTARKSVAQMVPRKQLAAQMIARKRAPTFKAATKAVEADNDDSPIGFSQFSLKFDDQKEIEKKAVEAKLVRCTNCQAILTSQSTIITWKQYQALKKEELQEDGAVADEINARYLSTKQQVWICEFCCNHNEVTGKYRPPKEQNPCIILSKPKNKGKGKKGQADEGETEDQLLVFVIDVSPSMGNWVTKESTRIDCVREAVQDEVNRMKMERSTKIVGLIAFGSEVIVFDHQKGKSLKMNSNNFENFEKIAAEASKYSIKNWEPINKKHKILEEILQKLPTSFGTAIGPALLTAVEIVAKGPTGSRVIICTDGESNVGIGSKGANDPFYAKIGEYAKDKGVSVSVLGIKGVDVNLKQLGKVTHATGGTVMKVDPLKIGTQFSKIINQQIVGSNAQVSIRLNSRFIFKNVDKKLLSEKNTLMKQNLGNFSTDTELAFEFQILKLQQAHDQVHINLHIFHNKKLPMQVELDYIGLDGTHYLQVVTDWREIQGDEKNIMAEVDFGIFIINALQKISKFISEDQLDKAGTFYRQVEVALKESVAKSKDAKEGVMKYKERLETLKKILKKRAKKRSLKVFEDESESEAVEDDEDASERSRSRSREKRRKGRTTKSAEKSKKADRSKSKGKAAKKSPALSKKRKERLEIASMSSSEQEAVLYTEMKAKQR